MQDVSLVIVIEDKHEHLEGVKDRSCFLDDLILSSDPRGYRMQKEQCA